MKANLESKCKNCNKQIKKGDEIENKNGSWTHKVCDIGKEIKKVVSEVEDIKKPQLKIIPDSPSQEIELMVRYHRDRAYKIVMAEVEDFSKLSDDKKRSLKIEENMLTKILVFGELKLREINNVTSKYK